MEDFDIDVDDKIIIDIDCHCAFVAPTSAFMQDARCRRALMQRSTKISERDETFWLNTLFCRKFNIVCDLRALDVLFC